MSIDFYYSPGSAPCRSVLLVAKVLGIDLNLKMVDLKKREHLTPEFVKINPKLTVPTLVDNGFALLDSSAILTYLVKKFDKNDSLYPNNLKKRTVINQRLYFDMDTLYPLFADCYYPTIFSTTKAINPGSLANAKNAFKILDNILEKYDYVAGDSLTVADLALVATVSTFDVMDFDLTPYKNVLRWYTKVKDDIPAYEEANNKNLLIFKQWVDNLIAKTR